MPKATGIPHWMVFRIQVQEKEGKSIISSSLLLNVRSLASHFLHLHCIYLFTLLVTLHPYSNL